MRRQNMCAVTIPIGRCPPPFGGLFCSAIERRRFNPVRLKVLIPLHRINTSLLTNSGLQSHVPQISKKNADNDDQNRNDQRCSSQQEVLCLFDDPRTLLQISRRLHHHLHLHDSGTDATVKGGELLMRTQVNHRGPKQQSIL